MRIVDLGPRYTPLRELGSGSSGRVLLVRDAHSGREVALKWLHESVSDEEHARRLAEEFRLLAEIDHPGLARVFDFGVIEERPFFTSEHIAGEPLSAALPLTSDGELAHVVRALCDAVAFLHRGNVLHLDIKPNNVILRAGEPRSPVLIDFGLHRRHPAPGAAAMPAGSLPYMAPECFEGGRLGAWTDVYALGVTLYQLATGRPPRRPLGNANGSGLERDAIDVVVEPPSCHLPGLPPAIDRAILRCLALDPKCRFASAVELADAVRTRGAEAVKRSDGPPPPLVGRATELAAIDAFLGRFLDAPSDSPSILLVTGPRGGGHSHLFRELKLRAQLRGIPTYLEKGYAGSEPVPGALLRCLAEHMDAGRDHGAPAGPRGRWVEFLQRLTERRRTRLSETLADERRHRLAVEVGLALGAVRGPCLLAVDGLQHWDEVTISLVVDLVRTLALSGAAERPRVALALGYREDGPAAPLLEELSELLLPDARVEVVTLRPLDPRETRRLFEERGGDARTARGLLLHQATDGIPARIIERVGASGASGREKRPTTASDPRGEGGAANEADELLVVLALLERPATIGELCRLASRSRRALERRLAELAERGVVGEVESAEHGEPGSPLDSRRAGWFLERGAERLIERAGRRTVRALHAHIAEEAVRRARRAGPGALAEAVRHFQQAGRRADVARHGVRLARYLSETHQNRAARSALEAVRLALPRGRRKERLEIALEIASLHARTGDFDDGIRLLRDVQLEESALSPRDRIRASLWLATLYGRAGEFKRSEALFAEGLTDESSRRAGLESAEYLFFLNEQAAVRTILGDHSGAKRLCLHGIELGRRTRSRALREVAVNLHATLASVALREFDPDRALASFETALVAAESLGSPANQALLLNNIGMVHAQRERYREAIRAFGEAERLCLRLDEGPSLVSIYGNLAILHARLGESAESRRYVDACQALHSGALGGKQRLFLEHAVGLCAVYEGNYGVARRHLERAIEIGHEIGESFVARFDEIYRGEALIFEARYESAEQVLRGVLGREEEGPCREMTLARLALLGGLTGQRGVFEEGASAMSNTGETFPYLRAWNRLFVAWARVTLGATAEAADDLRNAEQFFRENGIRPGADLAACVRAETELIDARRRGVPVRPAVISAVPLDSVGLARTVAPLLRARLLLEVTTAESFREAVDLLAKAGADIAENPLPEWEARLEAMSAAILVAGGSPRGRALRRDRSGACGNGRGERQRFESTWWRAWELKLPASKTPAAESGDSAHQVGSKGSTARTRTIAAQRGIRTQLVACSPAMRRVVQLLDAIRETDAPVLIEGETGSGKELIARIVHSESRRSTAHLCVVDCASLPCELIEAELFGASAGAYTDQSSERAGVLRRADGATVLLDGVQTLSAVAQAKLLRVLAEKAFRPLGAEDEVSVDVRFLFTTAVDLAAEVRAGRFRLDLEQRMRVLHLRLPPLRERPEDVAGLVTRFTSEDSGPAVTVREGVLERLRSLPWPGNVRELRNRLQRLRLAGGGEITRADLEEDLEASQESDARTTLFPRNVFHGEELEALQRRLARDYLLYHLQRLGGDTGALCRFLGIGERHLYRKCQQLGIRLREEKRRLRREER